MHQQNMTPHYLPVQIVVLLLTLVSSTSTVVLQDAASPPYPSSSLPTSHVFAIAEASSNNNDDGDDDDAERGSFTRSNAELLALDSLAGAMAKLHSPILYRVSFTDWRPYNMDKNEIGNIAGAKGNAIGDGQIDSYSLWLQEAEQHFSVTVDESLVSASLAYIISSTIATVDYNNNYHDDDDDNCSIVQYLRCNSPVHQPPTTLNSYSVTMAAAMMWCV